MIIIDYIPTSFATLQAPNRPHHESWPPWASGQPRGAVHVYTLIYDIHVIM